MPIRIGVIGTGGRLTGVCREILGNPQFKDEFEIAALCDTEPASIDRFKRTVPEGAPAPVYADYREMLKGAAIDLVLIGTPNYLHAEQAVAAMKAGRHVFCEKPLATTLEDLQALYDTYKQTDCRFMTGFTLRYAPLFRKFKDILESGALGEIISVESNETLDFCHGANLLVHPWRRYKRFSGGHLCEKCSHDIDLLNFAAGSLPRRVASFGGRKFFVPENVHRIDELGESKEGRKAYRGTVFGVNAFESDADVVDNQVVIIEYENDAHAVHHTNRNAGIPERRMHVNGALAGLRLDFHTSVIEWARIGFDEAIQRIDVKAEGGHGGGDAGIAGQFYETFGKGVAPEAGCHEGVVATATCVAAEESREAARVTDMRPIWERLGVCPDVSE